MQTMPVDHRPDSSLALLADPYRFIARECQRLGADLFEARILLERSICMTGPAAAQLFYDTSRFTRTGAAPKALRETLLGSGGVQTLDGAAHRHRKAMFMALMTPPSIARLTERMLEEWTRAARDWSGADVRLYEALHEPMMRAVCDWAGVPLPPAQVGERTHDLMELFDEAAAKGLGHIRSRLARNRAEKWIEAFIDDVRADRIRIPPDSPAERIAVHRDVNGHFLSGEVAAVELINVLRPILAVSVYIVHMAHALHRFPEQRDRLRAGDAPFAKAFTLEVRRFYPFFPAVVARVRRDFEWNGFAFAAGTQTLLDVYGTNRDPRTWDAPDTFDPERFLSRTPGAFEMIPQGGGDHYTNHRCPGEWITESLVQAATGFFSKLSYEVPEQDLDLDYGRLPALPKSRFVLRNTRTGI